MKDPKFDTGQPVKRHFVKHGWSNTVYFVLIAFPNKGEWYYKIYQEHEPSSHCSYVPECELKASRFTRNKSRQTASIIQGHLAWRRKCLKKSQQLPTESE